MSVYDTIKKLCDEKGIKVTALEKQLGFGRGSIGKMRNTSPSADRLQAIADYFGVTLDYLQTGKAPEGYYLNEEASRMAQAMFEDANMRSLFDMSRKMDPTRFQSYIDFLKQQYLLEHPEDGDLNDY